MKNDWKKIKNYYIHYDVSLRDCANKFKVSLGSVHNHCYKEKWIEAREKKREEIATKSEQKITNRKIAVNEKHFELYEKVLNSVESIFDSNKKITPYLLYQLVEVIWKAQRGQRLCLNMGADDITAIGEPEIRIINGIDINMI